MGLKPSLDGPIRRLFFSYGLFLHRFRWAILFLSLGLAGGLMTGMTLVSENTVNDFNYIFVPEGEDTRHKREFDEFQSRWPHDDEDFAAESSFSQVHAAYVYVSARERDGNLLRPDLAAELVRLQRRFDALSVDTGRKDSFYNTSIRWSYTDVCAGHKGDCYQNRDVVDLLRFLGPRQPLMDDNSTEEEKKYRFYADNFQLRWPRARKDRDQLRLANVVSAPRTVTDVDITDCYRNVFDYQAFHNLIEKLKALGDSNFFTWTPALEEQASVVGGADSPEDAASAMKSLEEMLREADVVGRVDFVNSVLLVYYVSQTGEKGRVAELWRKSLTEELLNLNSTLLKASLYVTHATLDDAIEALQVAITPKFAVAFLTMGAFACLSTLVLYSEEGAGTRVDWVRSKPYLAIGGVVSAGLAIGSAIGFLAYAGVAFNAVVCVMPILVISIGVDDMFVMVGEWERTSRSSPCPLRTAQTLSAAAVPITITTLTDFLGFAVGCFADIPCVRLFCLYTATAIALDYVFQVSLFAALMAVLGEAEEENRHSLTLHMIGEAVASNGDSSCLRRHLSGGRVVKGSWESSAERGKVTAAGVEAWRAAGGAASHQTSADGLIPRFFREFYGPRLMMPWARVAAALLYALYLFGAIWGCSIMGQGMEMRRIFYQTSEEGSINRLGRDFMLDLVKGSWRGGQTVQVLATKLPDLSQPIERQRLNASLGKFLGLDTTMGEDGVYLWLWDYERWFAEKTDGRELEGSLAYEFYFRLREIYLEGGSSSYPLTKVMKFESDERQADCDSLRNVSFDELCPFYRLTALRAHISLRDVGNTYLQARSLEVLREVAAGEGQWGWVVYYAFSPVLDGVLSLMPLTVRNLLIASGAMLVVAVVLIPSLPAALLVTLSVLSIDAGVFGFLALWGSNIDSISSIAILMAVGFGVDLSAHITHGFLSAEGGGQERSIRALETYGAAVLQGGLSTLLCIPALLLEIDHYIVQVFVKGIFLCITFGLLHSLIFLPQLLTFLGPSEWKSSFCLNRRRKCVDVVPTQSNSHISFTTSSPGLKL